MGGKRIEGRKQIYILVADGSGLRHRNFDEYEGKDDGCERKNSGRG
jgi:hypothetical protein